MPQCLFDSAWIRMISMHSLELFVIRSFSGSLRKLLYILDMSLSLSLSLSLFVCFASLEWLYEIMSFQTRDYGLSFCLPLFLKIHHHLS